MSRRRQSRSQLGNDFIARNYPSPSRNNSQVSLLTENKVLITGTTDRQYRRAIETFMNNVGPGQYNLPPLTGRISHDPIQGNVPKATFSKGNKRAFFPEFERENLGKYSPDTITPSPIFSGRSKLGCSTKTKRFQESKATIDLPISYQTDKPPELQLKYKQVSQGFGARGDFTKLP